MKNKSKAKNKLNRRLKSSIIINKFGGGIMIKEFIGYSLQRIKEQQKKGYQPIIVVSALKGITDELIFAYTELKDNLKKVNNEVISFDFDELINLRVKEIYEKHQQMINSMKISQELRPKLEEKLKFIFEKLKSDFFAISRFGVLDVFYDRILAYGEKLSALLYAFYLKSNGIAAKRIKTDRTAIMTDNNFSDANIKFKQSKVNLVKTFKNLKEIPVVTGFIGKSEKGSTTTLGRGGTDTTACFLGAALNAQKVILWKDVEGVMSADPKIVKKARNIDYLSYAEAEESGKVIHDKAIQYIKRYGIASQVASIQDVHKKTKIGPLNLKKKGPKIVSFKKGLISFEIVDDKISEYGFLYRISKIFNDFSVNMVLIRNTRDSLKIVVEKNNGNVKKATQTFKEEGYLVKTKTVDMVSLIGILDWNMVNDFNHILSQTAKDPQIGAFPYKDSVRLEAIVAPSDTQKVMRALHKKFIEK
jgi:aspartate kinase